MSPSPLTCSRGPGPTGRFPLGGGIDGAVPGESLSSTSLLSLPQSWGRGGHNSMQGNPGSQPCTHVWCPGSDSAPSTGSRWGDPGWEQTPLLLAAAPLRRVGRSMPPAASLQRLNIRSHTKSMSGCVTAPPGDAGITMLQLQTLTHVHRPCSRPAAINGVTRLRFQILEPAPPM